MTAVLRAEWTKLRSVRGTSWRWSGSRPDRRVLALLGAGPRLRRVARAATTTWSGTASSGCTSRSSPSSPSACSRSRPYATGLIHVTFAATPRRGRVLAAKALLVGVTVLVTGLAATATSFVAGQRVLRDNGYSPPGYPEWTLQRRPSAPCSAVHCS